MENTVGFEFKYDRSPSFARECIKVGLLLAFKRFIIDMYLIWHKRDQLTFSLLTPRAQTDTESRLLDLPKKYVREVYERCTRDVRSRVIHNQRASRTYSIKIPSYP